LNDSRKSVERKIFRHAKEMVAANPTWSEHAALVLAHAEWHPGVIGIVAARVAEHFERPAILISLDAATSIGQGSGRSFAGFDLYGGLARCAHHLESFGGHRAAAGLRISSDRIDDFRSEFCRTAAEGREVAPGAAELRIDAEVRLADVTRRAVGELERIGPFGCMNSRPLFAATKWNWSSRRVKWVRETGILRCGCASSALCCARLRSGAAIGLTKSGRLAGRSPCVLLRASIDFAVRRPWNCSSSIGSRKPPERRLH
jgi:single-stranded DNA-specific DHH superfamily exonuclease